MNGHHIMRNCRQRCRLIEAKARQVVFVKKATGIILFTCEDGLAIQTAIKEAIATGEGKTIICKSMGKNEAGESVAEFNFTWSFKAK